MCRSARGSRWTSQWVVETMSAFQVWTLINLDSIKSVSWLWTCFELCVLLFQSYVVLLSIINTYGFESLRNQIQERWSIDSALHQTKSELSWSCPGLCPVGHIYSTTGPGWIRFESYLYCSIYQYLIHHTIIIQIDVVTWLILSKPCLADSGIYLRSEWAHGYYFGSLKAFVFCWIELCSVWDSGLWRG